MVVHAAEHERGLSLDRFMMVSYGATAQDWEEATDDKHFVEFVDGMLIMHSPVGEHHAGLFDFCYPILSMFVAQRQLGKLYAGPFTMELGEQRKFEPDIIFVAERNVDRIDEDRLCGPADLVIEIASPSTRRYDRTEKRRWYAEGDVPEYWMIDGYDQQLVVDRPAGTQAISTRTGRVESIACPGFWVNADWFWQDPLPNNYTKLHEILGLGVP